MNWKRFAAFAFALLAVVLLSYQPAHAQATVGTGGIQGTITDPQGAAVPTAKVMVLRTGTGQTINAPVNSSGIYNVGGLVPGVFTVRVEAANFKTVENTVTVQVGVVSGVNFKLELGAASTIVEVTGTAVAVNTEQATVQGVLSRDTIENLPINGRNFLDLAQLEPGVQIQDGQNFDPTKAGYSSISFGGRFGRTARIMVDGVDVSDETVGTTTTDVPASAIQEFQISQSSLDMSTELTSSGAINVTTRSGSNSFHGGGFGTIRDDNWAANLPIPVGFASSFQRSQFGGDFGGPILKDKLFFFLDGERTIQYQSVPVPVSDPFSAFSGTWPDKFHEGNLLGRLDYQLSKSVHLFGRVSYFKNILGADFGFGYSVYNNKDITRNFIGGADFTSGSFSHAIRFSYLKFQNQIQDATIGSTTLPFANLGAEIFMGGTGLVAGPNLLAPQSTPQSNHQIKYDGSKVLRTHILRYGIAYNHLQGGGFASFFKNGPQIISNVSDAEVAAAATGPFPGGSSNPLNYPADNVTIANGLGFSTTKAALGFPAGGLGPDNRVLFYFGDSWKVKPNFTLNYGIRYQRDTGRTDSQYPAIPGLSALFPGLGNSVKQPNSNWGPQLGFAWDPRNDGKTVIRAGIGYFYENAIWNNVLFDGPLRQPTGAFLQFFSPCAAPGSPNTLQTVNGPINTPGSASAIAVCGAPGAASFPLIGTATPDIIALQQAYVAGSPFNLQAANPAYVQPGLADCPTATLANKETCFFPPGNPANSGSMFFPNYKTPRSVQMNFGFQRELRPGMVLSADFVRNVQTHFLLGVDQNHAGDIRYFDKKGAQSAIATTLAQCGVASIDAAIAACPGLHPAAGGNPVGGATMSDFAAFGLGSSADQGGNSCIAALGYNCAFGGINPTAPPLAFLEPVGRSTYDGLQLKLTENINHPFRGTKALNFQVSYALSRFDNSGGNVTPDNIVTAASADQDFIIPALDQSNVNRYYGPSTLDRTHQLSFGGYLQTRYGFQFGLIAHFYSPLANSLIVPNTGSGAGEIFRTDFTGDGTTQDPLPGTKVGEWMRGINASNINNYLINYNTFYSGRPTPAGNVLIQNGLMTEAQLVALGGVAPAVPLAPANQVNYPWLRALDATIGWNYSVKERLTIQPSVGFYNLFNMSNFDLPQNMMSGSLAGTGGTINGTGPAEHFANRVGVGTGVYTLGAPRVIEFGLKLTF
jgi:Carboxypeptidase regulatory-like domain